MCNFEELGCNFYLTSDLFQIFLQAGMYSAVSRTCMAYMLFQKPRYIPPREISQLWPA